MHGRRGRESDFSETGGQSLTPGESKLSARVWPYRPTPAGEAGSLVRAISPPLL